jgi:death-on-curing protein
MDQEPVWLRLHEVLTIHERLASAHHTRIDAPDLGLLEAALARPQHLQAYGSPDLFDLAAAYAFGIARDHPFPDGNKRVAFVTAAAFIRRNGHRLRSSEQEAVAMTLGLAAGELPEDGFARWLRGASVPWPPQG